jgi:hypothetical protein
MTKTSIHTENTFETSIVEHLYENGWTLGAAGNFDKDLALDKRAVLDFVQKTQPIMNLYYCSYLILFKSVSKMVVYGTVQFLNISSDATKFRWR